MADRDQIHMPATTFEIVAAYIAPELFACPLVDEVLSIKPSRQPEAQPKTNLSRPTATNLK